MGVLCGVTRQCSVFCYTDLDLTTANRFSRLDSLRRGLLRSEWAILLCLLLVSAGLRLWRIGEAPGGLYRDEAYNGLDALNVLAGRHALYFPANNGREPVYIYLTAASVAIFGRTALAVRLPSALIGVLTTLSVAGLARAWFGRRVGWLAGWLWAVTLWPMHLGRIGFRATLLPLALSLAVWLGVCAYRRSGAQAWRWWLAAGLVYGVGFYTYLAMRFTPLWLVAVGLYLLATGRGRRLWPGLAWWGLGLLLAMLPLAWQATQTPEMIFGRIAQVSVFDPAISGGHPWATLARHIGQALGMFIWRGDAILRHNPAGRPVFDWLMAAPFLIGVGWCLSHWRRPAAAALLLWALIMLGPTILAEDTPHFLRAVGVLPAILIFPALGLSHLWSWSTLPRNLPIGLVLAIVAGSMFLTMRDYFGRYVGQPDTDYLFEAAARDLAETINADSAETRIYVDQRYQTGWPSVRFLLAPTANITWFQAETGLPGQVAPPADLFIWPYTAHDYVAQAILPPAELIATPGSLARNDLDPVAAPLYTRYQLQPLAAGQTWPLLINFAGQLQLLQAELTQLAPDRLQLDLVWQTPGHLDAPVTVFVHVLDGGHLLAQHDAPPAADLWAADWWQPGLVVQDRHPIQLPVAYDPAAHEIRIGVYRQADQARLSVVAADGVILGDSWLYLPAR